MIAEPSSASLVSRLPVPETTSAPQGYYRSKLFIAPKSTNSLVAAAGPIFSLLERLAVSQTLPPIHGMHDNIKHEINAFHSQLMSLEYTEELIVIAKFLLCATIDEVLAKNIIRISGKPAKFQAFTQYSNDDIGPQKRFFEIVAYIKERPNQYLDLVELAYYCLIGGFEGEYHLKVDGRQALENVIEELYLLIQTNRRHKPVQLFSETNHSRIKRNDSKPVFLVGA